MSTILSLRPWRIEKGKKKYKQGEKWVKGALKEGNFIKLQEADQLSHCSLIELCHFNYNFIQQLIFVKISNP